MFSLILFCPSIFVLSVIGVDTTGLESSLSIVPTAQLSLVLVLLFPSYGMSVLLMGLVKAIPKTSFGSTSVSPLTSTLIILEVSPAAKVSVCPIKAW